MYHSTSTDSVPRKHRQQMTAAEITTIESLVHSTTFFAPKPHLIERAAERNFGEAGIMSALRTGMLIEARPDGRVCMRHDGYCVVASVATRRIITCWRNDDNDQHSTLNLRAYQWHPANAAAAMQEVARVH